MNGSIQLVWHSPSLPIPESPHLFEKMSLTPLIHGWACELSSERIHSNTSWAKKGHLKEYLVLWEKCSCLSPFLTLDYLSVSMRWRPVCCDTVKHNQKRRKWVTYHKVQFMFGGMVLLLGVPPKAKGLADLGGCWSRLAAGAAGRIWSTGTKWWTWGVAEDKPGPAGQCPPLTSGALPFQVQLRCQRSFRKKRASSCTCPVWVCL